MSGKYWNYKVCVIDDQHNIKSMLVRDDIYSILVAPYICPTKLINSVTNNIYFSIKIDISLINLPTNGKCSIKKRVHGCQKLFLIIMDEYNMSGRMFYSLLQHYTEDDRVQMRYIDVNNKGNTFNVGYPFSIKSIIVYPWVRFPLV